MVIGLKRAGWSIRQIAADTHLGASTVHRLWRRWLEQGNVAIYRNAGATRVTSARVDRRILRQAVAAPQATCTAILQHVQDTLDHSISTRTISRRLVANGLHSCRPLRRLPLTLPNRRQRLEWCRARSTWMMEWHRVVFSDESRFCLSSDSRHVRVWRRRGERSNPAAIVERPTVRQRGIMVWGAIAYDSRSPLLRIQGTMTAQRYVDDVLRPVTLPYLQGVPNALYQQDNARPHTARISQQALQDVQMLPWPPYSPDLSPIEHVWDIIGRRLHALPQPRSEDELWQMVEREWRAIPQDAIRTLIDSLPRRVAACIAVRGHLFRACRNRPNQNNNRNHKSFNQTKVKTIQEENKTEVGESSDEYTYYTGAENKEKVQIDGSEINMIIDTGSDRTFISYNKMLELYGHKIMPKLHDTTRTFFAYGQDRPLPCYGYFNAAISWKENSVSEEIYVIDKKVESLLGGKASFELGIIKRVNHVNESMSTNIETLVQEHEHLFHGLGTIKGYSHKVTLKDNYRPIAQRCRRIPYAMVEAVNQELDKMLENGIIEEVHQGSEWVSNIIVVPKRDSEEIRLCIDLREVNKAILRERHPIPTIDNMLHALKGAKVFAKLDAKKGFWQVDLDPQSKPLTTFITHRGCYRFCKVPFGLSSAPEAYQKGMDSILLDLKGVICYLDDVVVYAKDRQELEERLRKVLQRFDKVGIRLNRNKCKFAMEELDILGHIVSSEGIKPDNRKIEAVLNFPIQKNIEMLRSFLGTCGFLRKFIPNFSKLAEPLNNLTRKNVRWNWDLKTNKAFQDLKESLTKEPCLAYYNLNSPTELITDASPIGLGAVLIQTQQNGIKRPIAYASRSLTDTVKRYSQIEKETLGCVWAIEHFNTYIWGRKFVLKTDHKPLIYMLNPKNGAVLPPRIQRLSWRLQPYDFEIEFIQGKQNIADIFSRQPLSNTSDEKWLENYVHKVLSITSEELQALSLKEIKVCTEQDPLFQKLKDMVQKGVWPYPLNEEFKCFYKFKDELSIFDNLILKGKEDESNIKEFNMVYKEKMKTYNDIIRKASPHNFEIGNLVYVANPNNGKLDSNFRSEHHVILENTSINSFKLVNTKNGKIIHRNAKHLKHVPTQETNQGISDLIPEESQENLSSDSTRIEHLNSSDVQIPDDNSSNQDKDTSLNRPSSSRTGSTFNPVVSDRLDAEALHQLPPEMAGNMPNLVPASSLEKAESVPERPSFVSETGEEESPKNNLQKKTSENQKHANSPAGGKHANPAAALEATAPTTAGTTSATPASPASLNWADSEMAEVDANEGFTVVKSKKRRRTSTTPEHAAKQPSRPAEKPSSQQLKRPTGPRTVLPKEIKATRANIAEAKARQASTNHENYIFVELCPDIPDYSCLRAIGDLVGGPKNITHFGRMNGHYIVGLASRNLASRLVEEGLNIEGTLLRVFPFRKRAERIIVANLPGFVEDATIVQALRKYGDITSIAPIMIKMGEFAFSDGRREAFILLHEGVRLETLPARLTIQSKGDSLSAFLSFGIKCSKCGRQGHRRASCPSLARRNFDAPKRVDNPAQVQAASSSPTVPKRTGPPTPEARLQRLHLQTPSPGPALPPSRDIIIGFTIASINARGLATRNKSLSLCHLLRQHRVDIALVQETNTHHLDGAQDLCLGYDAITAPPDAISGSGLACIYASGVTVSRHRILWPGHIVLAAFNVHGQEMTVINLHLSHDQRERIEQLRVIEAATVEEEEEAWVLGDFNIRDDRNHDSISMAALGALCESAALLDAAPEFDAAHLPTRVAAHGDLIESSRLDRILAPARFLEVSTSYAIAPFHLSDHRMVLLRVGPPAAPYQPRVAATLRSGLAQEHMNNYLVDIAEEISMLDAPQLWDRWTLIKAGILAEAHSLHDPRHHDRDDSYIGRAQRYIRVQLEASSTNADYPSLSDLARHRRPAVTTIRDENGEVIEGPVLRRKALDIFRPRFARPSCDPAEYAAFIGATTTTPIELGEEDPLHRAEVSEAEHLRGILRGRPATCARRVSAPRCPASIDAPERDLPGPQGPRRRSRSGRLQTDLPAFGRLQCNRIDPAGPPQAPPPNSGAGVPDVRRPRKVPLLEHRAGHRRRRGGYCPRHAAGRGLRGSAVRLRLPGPRVSNIPPGVPPAPPTGLRGMDPSTLRRGGRHNKGRGLPDRRLQTTQRRETGLRSERGALQYRDGTSAASPGDDPRRGQRHRLRRRHRAPDTPRRAVREGCRHLRIIPSSLGDRGQLLEERGPLVRRLARSRRLPPPRCLLVELLDPGPGDQNSNQELRSPAGATSSGPPGVRLQKNDALHPRPLPCRASQSSQLPGPLHHPAPPPRLPAGGLHHLQAAGPRGPFHLGARPHGVARLRHLSEARCHRGPRPNRHRHPTPSRLSKRCPGRASRGGKNGFSWLVTSEAWLRPPPDGTTLQPRRLRLLKLWEETSGVLSLDHRAAPTTQLLDLPIIGGFRFLRPPNLLAPSRWVGARVRDLGDDDHHTIVTPHPTRSALADAAALAAFCRRIVAENIQASYRVLSLAEAVVLRGTTKPLARITTRSARRALDRPRLEALPIHRLLARWTPTVDVPPRVKKKALLGREWINLLKIDYFAVNQIPSEIAIAEFLKEHQVLFNDTAEPIKGFTFSMNIRDVSPIFHKARPVPFAIRTAVTEALENMVTKGYLYRVRSSQWATPVVVVPKKNKEMRICCDFKVTLNRFLDTAAYPLPTQQDLFAILAKGKYFSKLDLSSAYLQLEVATSTQPFLTINTHKGLFRFRRMPFGLANAPSYFQSVMDRVLAGIEGVICYIDDVLIATVSVEKHLAVLKTVFLRLEKYNIKLKKDKCKFVQREIEYLGHLIKEDGIRPLDHKVQALQKAKCPTNISELRSFLGLVNYYGKFIPNLPDLLRPLHELLHKKNCWSWTKECEEAIEKCKSSITSERVLVPYDTTLPLFLATDASQIGIGAVLSHVIGGQERPIMFASRTLSGAERNYSQIEREALAIIYGVTKFHQFIYGRRFTLITDHKPLVSILGPKSGIPTLSTSRLQRWAIILSAYTYDIKFKKTQDHGNADLLSRLPVESEETSRLDNIYALSYMEDLPITAEEIRIETQKDEVLSIVKCYTQHGWPERVPDHLRPYFQRKLELTVDGECLLWGMRVIIPSSLRPNLLSCLHETHSGMSKMKSVARSHFWWPNLDNEIEFLVNRCGNCQQVQDGPNRVKWQPWIWAVRPWQRIHIDYANKDNINLLIVVDSHSKWVEAFPMREITSAKTIEQLRRLFSSYGLPEEIVSDNGPQFTGSDMKFFLKNNGIKQTLIPAYHPQSNGLAERAVKMIKMALDKNKRKPGDTIQDTLSKILLAYRSTPHETTKKAPSELFIGRSLRTRLSIIHPNLESIVKEQQARQMKYDHGFQQDEFGIDDMVWCRNFRGGDRWIPGRIVGRKGSRVYTVLIHGQVKSYHRDQIRKRWENGGDEDRQYGRQREETDIIVPEADMPNRGRSESPPIETARQQRDSGLVDQNDGGISGKSMVETRSGKMQDPAQERIMPEESAKPQPGATIGRDASSDPVVLNPNIDIPKFDGTEDPRPWIESLEEIGFLYHWADYIISRYAAMNMIGSAKTWLNLHKISFTSWENFKSRLIQDFASDANKEEMKMRLNRMQQWNEPAIRFAEDILVLCNKVDPQMEEETKINWVIGGLKKEYSFALHLNPPKNTNELLEICKKLDLFEKNYQERAEKSKALYNGPRSPRPHHQEQWKNATSFRRPYQNTSKPQAPAPRYYQNTSKPQAPTPRYYQNKPLPQVSAPRRSYTPNPEPKPVYPSKTYNKNPNSNRNRTEDGRPICFKCNKPGHVARYCRVRIGICEALIDTGADLSVVDLNTALNTGLEIINPDKMCSGPDGKELDIVGNIILNIKFDDKTITHQFVIMRTHLRIFILGRDFLKKMNAKIDCQREIIKYDLTENRDVIKYQQKKIKSAKDAIIPELSIKLINAFVEAEDGEYIIEENHKMFQTNGLRLARSLINVVNKETYIWITNPYPRPLKILKNQTLCFGSQPAEVNLVEESEQKEHEEPQFQINENLAYKEKEQLKQVLERYEDLFSSGLGRSNLAKHRIDTEGAKPIKHKPYRVSAKEREIIKEQIDEMLRDGIIRPSSSPWSFPVILVKKRDGKYRFCVDYRKLNDVTVKDVYPIPRIDEVLDTLQGSKYFSAIDLKSGYWQVEVEEKDKEKTAFTTAHGLYEFNVMPFGLCNAPATFERNMENMLGNLRWQICLCYLDDVIIYSSDFSTHLKRIEAVLKCFREADLKLNNKKCQFAFEELEILGHITNQHGIKPAEHNIKAIRDFPRPKKIKEVQSFLGMCSYYRKFIKGFSKIADPLTSLIKKNVPFTWTENQEKAFQTLKVALINPPILGHFDPNAITYIHTDASNIGLGATLVQKFGDKEKVISYLSRTLSKPEQNYSTTEKECLAVVWSMSKLRPYLYGRHFKIVTDHHALCWLKNLKDPTGRLARWALKIQEYNFEIIHKSGKKHLDADGLSRGPLSENEWDEDYERLFLNQIIDEKDDFIENIKENLSGNKRSITQNFKEENGCLYKKNPNPEGRAWLLVVPKKRRKEVMSEYHNHMLNGHLGVARTTYRLKNKYYWPSMLKDVSEFVKTCHLCQSRKGSNHLPSGLLQPIPPANYPFERIGIDFVGPLPSTKRRRKWIIVLTDYYTKYAETKAVSEATVKEVSTFLIEHIILRHGAPKFLISDRGSQFTSNLMKEVMKMCKVKHCFTTSYHPQTNGLTERLNRTLINMISMYVNTDQKNWDEILPFITHAYNTTIQETTGYSPFFLLFGREPMSLLDDENIPTDSNMDDYDEYIENYLNKIARTRQVVINNTEKTQERMKRNYDKKHNEKIYEPGHLVAVWTPVRKIGKCEKLLRKYFGPYRILKKLSNVNYLIEPKDNPGQDPLIVHVSRLKPYFERIDEVTHED
ncbi:hypothetical protein LAZ67_3005963, partial [Cordylochernes scorpioides]